MLLLLLTNLITKALCHSEGSKGNKYICRCIKISCYKSVELQKRLLIFLTGY